MIFKHVIIFSKWIYILNVFRLEDIIFMKH